MFSIIIISILFIGLSFLAPVIGMEMLFHDKFLYQVLFFLFINLFVHRLLEMGLRNNNEDFISYYLGSIVAKIIISLTYIGIFLYIGTENMFLFVINFFVLYLFYTCFEISGIYRKLRRD